VEQMGEFVSTLFILNSYSGRISYVYVWFDNLFLCICCSCRLQLRFLWYSIIWNFSMCSKPDTCMLFVTLCTCTLWVKSKLNEALTCRQSSTERDSCKKNKTTRVVHIVIILLPRDATVCRLSVCNVQVPWSHRLETWNTSQIISRLSGLKGFALNDHNMGDLVQRKHPTIRVE